MCAGIYIVLIDVKRKDFALDFSLFVITGCAIHNIPWHYRFPLYKMCHINPHFTYLRTSGVTVTVCGYFFVNNLLVPLRQFSLLVK